MAGYALYGMAPCFGHTGVTFDAEMIGLVPAASVVILRLFFETEGFVLRL